MRSHKGLWQLTVLLGAWMLAAQGAAEGTARVASPAGTAASQAAIEAAIAALKQDPNLGGEAKVRVLKWTRASQQTQPSSLPQWILGLFEYVSQLSGLLLWAAGAITVAVAAVWGYRTLHLRRPRTQAAHSAPGLSQILDLDISPDSLPLDVVAAALSLSRAGQLRECLSLLYRAALSRAVNRFGAVIGPSLTEREALRAAQASLDEPRANYFAELVRTWQRVVYAGEGVAPEEVARLCARFGETLDGGVSA